MHAVRLVTFFLRLALIFARFIYKSGCGIHISRYLKEDLALAIDKQFQCTISYLHYMHPTRDMQISYKLTFSYPKSFSYLNVFENREVQRCSDNRGSTVHINISDTTILIFFIQTSFILITMA